tara:strand:- start:166 stop:459 length:294 start_codon:yes stop_codon:yes gene_type:complete
MKTNKLKLDKIESLGSGVQVAHMTLEIKLAQYCESVKLSSAGLSLRIESSLLTNEIYQLMKWLDKKDDEVSSNQSQVISFAKEMIDANKKLKNIKYF